MGKKFYSKLILSKDLHNDIDQMDNKYIFSKTMFN